jgi:hypothetical protein
MKRSIMKIKELIIHLIREELRNQRLMRTLEEVGCDSSFFTLNISQVILELAGFTERTDQLYEWYFGLLEKSLSETTFDNLDEMLEKWSLSIYIELLEKKLKDSNVLLREDREVVL